MISDTPGQQPSQGEYPFWDRPEKWPHDPPGQGFLARACHDVGRALFGAEWAESWGEPNEPPDDCDLATWDDYERKCDAFQNAFVAMRSEVVRVIARECEAGTLVAAARPKVGGEMIKIEQHLWSLESVERRFQRCDMSLDNPFETGGGAHRPYWIYIDRSLLDGFLNGSHQSAPAPKFTATTPPKVTPSTNAFHQPRKHMRLLAQRALVAIYGLNGPDLGETEAECLYKVNEWLRTNGKNSVGRATLGRAKRALRTGTGVSAVERT